MCVCNIICNVEQPQKTANQFPNNCLLVGVDFSTTFLVIEFSIGLQIISFC